MKLSAFSRPFGHSLLGSIGLGVLLCGVVPSAQAGSGLVRSGTDYVGTPIGAAKYQPPTKPGHPKPPLVSFTGFAIKSPSANPLFDPTANIDGSPHDPIKYGPDGGTTPIPNTGLTPIIGVADTVINRTKDKVDLSLLSLNPITGLTEQGGVTPIEVVGLSLKSENRLTLPSFGTRRYYAGLEKYYGTNPTPPLVPPITGQRSSTGEMFIRGDGGIGGTWDSKFTIYAMAFGLPNDSTLDTTANDFVRQTLEGMITPLNVTGDPYACKSIVGGFTYDLACLAFTKPNFIVKDKKWSATLPLGSDTLTGPNLVPVPIDPLDPNTDYYKQDFFLTDSTIPHDAGDGSIHDVSINRRFLNQYAVPGPLPILGVSTAYAFARRLRKRCREAVKAC
jgi:hypothetical protein